MRRRSKDEDPYLMALDRLIAGEDGEAFECLKEVISREPANVDAYVRLGKMLRERGETKRAIRLHRDQTVRSGLSPGEKSELFENLARDYWSDGDTESALQWAQEYVKQDRKNPTAFRLLASLYEERAEWDDAFRCHEKRLRLEKRGDNRFLAMHRAVSAQYFLETGRVGKAEDYYKKALKLDRASLPALIGLGDLYYSQKKIGKAIKVWKNLFERCPCFAYLAFDRVEVAYYEKDRFDRIVGLYRDLIEKIPEDSRPRIALAEIYRRMGDVHSAIDVCRQALEFDPGSRKVLTFLALIYSREEDCSKAADLLQEAIAGKGAVVEEFVCSECSLKSGVPVWRCPQCKRWGTFVADLP